VVNVFIYLCALSFETPPLLYYIEESKVCHELIKVDSVSDFKLCFSDHVNEKIRKDVINRNFIYMDKITLTLLYKSMVRLNLECANAVWCPYKRDDTETCDSQGILVCSWQCGSVSGRS